MMRRWTDKIDMFGVITYSLIMFVVGFMFGLLTDLYLS